ncbi:kininogen-1 isoform X1 [Channa argus]|uniref:kininogen-1 isoform X1 n=2 Tax=Channa argus TaxID=215402 RepID=UPI00352293AF
MSSEEIRVVEAKGRQGQRVPPTVSGEFHSVVLLCVDRSWVFPLQARQDRQQTVNFRNSEPNIRQDPMMRSGVGLCVLALLCLHSSAWGQDAVNVQPGVLIFCDDPSVEKAVSSAVTKFNEKLTNGHKLALYQILTASKSENDPQSVYSLQFTTRRSDCLVGSNKTWTDCDYLPYGHRRPILCNATVYMTETDADTKQVDCHIEGHITPEKAHCLGCPVEIDENSEDIRVPLTVSISKYNSMLGGTHLFTLHNIDYATRQVVAGLRFKLRFDMRRTVCAKAEHKDLNELCVFDEQNVEFANCNATVDIAPWRFENPEPHLQCEEGPLQMSTFSRRRPPGWTPLRHLLYEDSSSTAPRPATQAPPQAAVKESSEEDATGSKPTAATKAAETVNDKPFHCPSKPWKPFHEGHSFRHAVPVKPVVEVPPPPSADGALKDSDLLA